MNNFDSATSTIDIAKQTEPGLNPEAWFILTRTPGLGLRKLQKLLIELKTPENILGASQQQLSKIVTLPHKSFAALAKPDKPAIIADLDWLSQPDNHLVSILDPRYPTLLQQISDPPTVLFCCGNPNLLSQAQIAIVGSRNPDHYGKQSAFEFSKYLSLNGIIVTSGLALGIDGEAHNGAIAAEAETIAVAATGLDRVYPARHKELAHKIVSNGLIVSEQTRGTPPVANHFPRRNRIISGLSLGTLVVQGALKSGSLITARLAMEQNREVFALPGSIHNPLSKGCHQLIRQGAKLVETTQDILVELAPQLHFLLESSNLCNNPSKDYAIEGMTQQVEADQSLTDRQKKLLAIIGYEVSSIDTLVERSEWSSDAVSCVVLELELLGLLKSSAGVYHRT